MYTKYHRMLRHICIHLITANNNFLFKIYGITSDNFRKKIFIIVVILFVKKNNIIYSFNIENITNSFMSKGLLCDRSCVQNITKCFVRYDVLQVIILYIKYQLQ